MKNIVSNLLNNQISFLNDIQDNIKGLIFEKEIYEINNRYSFGISYKELIVHIEKQISQLNDIFNKRLIELLSNISKVIIYEIKEKVILPQSYYFLDRCIFLIENNNVDKKYIIENVRQIFEHVNTVAKLYNNDSHDLIEKIQYFIKY